MSFSSSFWYFVSYRIQVFFLKKTETFLPQYSKKNLKLIYTDIFTERLGALNLPKRYTSSVLIFALTVL